MSLAAGSQLGGFEILSELGRGGMGVVWRARDTTLGREVAIKVLPDAVARDPDRLARFEREARVLASLNHPNVAHLYGFFAGDASAASAASPLAVESAPLPFLVMELVPGETLADRLARGRLTIDETITIFLEIARGLEAAHARGVIHRDLKPANVKIAAEDAGRGSSSAGTRVKILDFGLAKAMVPDRDSGGAVIAESPTLTLAATQRGEILGTAAYMSPEQARGRTVDERTDVWAFGVCLYEALTGVSPFTAEDAPGTLAKVLESKPALDAIPPTTPAPLRRLLRRCLVKNPAQRLHHIADARLELEDALERDPADPAAPGSGARATGWSGRSVALGTAAALVLGVASGAAIGRLAAPRTRAPLERFEVVADGIGQRDLVNEGSAVALAPGTGDLVIAATRNGASRLWRRRLASVELEPIVGTEGGHTPLFLPGGKWLTFATEAALMKVPAAGGLPQRVQEIRWLDFGFDWAKDGALAFADDREELQRARIWIVPANGTARRISPPDATPPKQYGHVWPHLLPGGRALLFAEWERDEATMRVMALEIESGEIHPLLPGSYPRYYPVTGHLLFTRTGSLWAAPFDPAALELLGPAVRVADDVATQSMTGCADYALGDDGTLVYRRGEPLQPAKLTWIDAAGSRIATSIPAGDYAELALSPDGGRVAVSNAADSDLWVYDIESGAATRLAFAESLEVSPAWSEDGRRLAFSAIVPEKGGLYATRADGSAPPERLGDAPAFFGPKIWIERPPGLLGEVGVNADRDIVFMHLDGDKTAERLIATPFREVGPALSPDQRWLAYESDESGQAEIYLRPFPDVTRGRWQVSRGGGSQAEWDASGERIYYRNGTELVAVSIVTGAGEEVAVGQPRTLVTLGAAPSSSQIVGKSFAAARGGQRFLALVNETEPASGGARLVLVKNFASELPRLAPRN